MQVLALSFSTQTVADCQSLRSRCLMNWSTCGFQTRAIKSFHKLRCSLLLVHAASFLRGWSIEWTNLGLTMSPQSLLASKVLQPRSPCSRFAGSCNRLRSRSLPPSGMNASLHIQTREIDHQDSKLTEHPHFSIPMLKLLGCLLQIWWMQSSCSTTIRMVLSTHSLQGSKPVRQTRTRVNTPAVKKCVSVLNSCCDFRPRFVSDTFDQFRSYE